MTDGVLVTGGTGFVAGWTIVELLKRGYAVRTTVRAPAKRDQVLRAVGTQVELEGRLSFVLADLTADEGWLEAAEGCEAVLHIASPLGAARAGDLIAAAREGTLRVLCAAAAAGARRVVMTSSTAACTPGSLPDRPVDESDWTDPDQKDLAEYRRSKVLAERAGWAFAADNPGVALTTLLPGAIFGPVLSKAPLGSVGIIDRLLKGQPPALPRLGFNITDVRDLADLHIRALETSGAAGERFIALGEALWYADIARTLRTRLGSLAAKVPTDDMPDLVAKGLAAVNPQMKALLPLLGRTQAFSTEKARRVLGFRPRSAVDTIADCGASLAA